MENTCSSQSAEGIRAEIPWLNVVLRLVSTLQYGSVNIIVHEGRITQIERNERVRFGKSAIENQHSHDGQNSFKPSEPVTSSDSD